MISIQTSFLFFILWIKCHAVQNQYVNGYGSGSYCESYNYPYGQSAYDYSSSAPTVYMSTYPQLSPYEYYQQSSYNSYTNECQQPIVIVINGDDNDDDLDDVISFVASMKKKTDSEPVYVAYPIPVPCCDSCGCDSDYDYSDSGCKSSRCGCSDSESCCDCCSNGENNCGECRKRHPKSKCGCNSRCGCSNSDCGCNKCIKHKSDRCCRG